jgi:hypothetical protein
MKILLIIPFLFFSFYSLYLQDLYSQGLHSKSDDTEQGGLVVQETKKGTLKTYTGLDGNKVEELWKNYAADGTSQVNLFLRTKTFYKGNPPKRVKKETYYMADKNLKTREYFDENENINISEHYYLRLQTNKKR